MKKALSANDQWLKTLHQIIIQGEPVCPRGLQCKEILAHTNIISMRQPVVTVEQRKLGRRFLCAEAAWILSGDNRVSTIEPYSPIISKFSDDGTRFFGAYGPRIVDQLSYVIGSLCDDHDTRQAVMSIWRSNPIKTRDVPCTIAVQWFLRKEHLSSPYYLHCVDTMRSSDVWLGLPYDTFNFSMLSGYIAASIKQRQPKIDLELGNLYLIAGSQHLYDTNLLRVKELLPVAVALPYQPFDYREFVDCPQELIDHLWLLAKQGTGLPDKKWLTDLFAATSP